jgi:hypothetical protein
VRDLGALATVCISCRRPAWRVCLAKGDVRIDVVCMHSLSAWCACTQAIVAMLASYC